GDPAKEAMGSSFFRNHSQLSSPCFFRAAQSQYARNLVPHRVRPAESFRVLELCGAMQADRSPSQCPGESACAGCFAQTISEYLSGDDSFLRETVSLSGSRSTRVPIRGSTGTIS